MLLLSITIHFLPFSLYRILLHDDIRWRQQCPLECFEGLYEEHDSFNLLESPCCFCFANSLICTVFFISLLLCVTHFVSGCHHMWRSQEMSIKNKQIIVCFNAVCTHLFVPCSFVLLRFSLAFCFGCFLLNSSSSLSNLLLFTISSIFCFLCASLFYFSSEVVAPPWTQVTL